MHLIAHPTAAGLARGWIAKAPGAFYVLVGLEFDAIAAVILGGASFEKGRGGLIGTVVGTLAVGVLRDGLNLAGIVSGVADCSRALHRPGVMDGGRARGIPWRRNLLVLGRRPVGRKRERRLVQPAGACISRERPARCILAA